MFYIRYMPVHVAICTRGFYMRVLVVSDSHGRGDLLKKAIFRQPKAERIIFLGDGLSDLDAARADFPERAFYAVRGNGDFYADEPDSDSLTLDSHRLFFAHGHLYGVKGGFQPFLGAARAQGADIALFGHTHRAESGYEDGLYWMNPGALSRPVGGRPSCGVLDLTGAGVVLNIIWL